MLEDRLLEPLQLLARLEAELLGEQVPTLLVRRERLRLPTRPIEADHELGSQTLPERVLRDKSLELADDLGMAALRQIPVDAPLQAGEL